MSDSSKNSEPKRINLALQGGGAHGAYTWGVLDQLLQDGRFVIDGISGTSAGAMNAVALAAGYYEDGPEGARKRLREFWEAVAQASRYSPVRRSPLDVWMGNWSLDDSPALTMMDVLATVVSPYDMNPFDINPLRDIVEQHVDFRCVRECRAIKLFVAATNVHNGKVRVFHNQEMHVDAVMASACLPQLFKAVEIDGVPYWDGGYMGNPVLFPFFYETDTDDVVLVQINPVERPETPKTAREIANRVSEITFNASLLREFRAIEFVSRQVREGRLPPDEFRDVRVHRVGVSEELSKLSASSKMNAQRAFLEHLHDLGQEAARHWLDQESQHVGVRSGIALHEEIAYTLQGDKT